MPGTTAAPRPVPDAHEASAPPAAAPVALPLPPVHLSPRREADAPRLFPVLSEPELYTYLGELPPPSVEVLRQHLAASDTPLSPDGTQHWLNWVLSTGDGEVAGLAQATVHPDGCAFLAYLLGSRFRGRGLAQAAVQQMMALVGRAPQVRVRRWLIQVNRHNLRSLRVAQRAGFQPAPAALAVQHRVPDTDLLFTRDALGDNG